MFYIGSKVVEVRQNSPWRGGGGYIYIYIYSFGKEGLEKGGDPMPPESKQRTSQWFRGTRRYAGNSDSRLPKCD